MIDVLREHLAELTASERPYWATAWLFVRGGLWFAFVWYSFALANPLWTVIVAGGLAADMGTWFAFRVLELPHHPAAFGAEAIVQLSIAYVLLDVTPLLERIHASEHWPFGALALLGVGTLKSVWWVVHRLHAH